MLGIRLRAMCAGQVCCLPLSYVLGSIVAASHQGGKEACFVSLAFCYVWCVCACFSVYACERVCLRAYVCVHVHGCESL